MSDDIRELTEQDFARAIPRRQRERIIRGQIDPKKDIVALRRFAGLTQEEFAEALGISVHTLRNWEQGRRTPEGPASGTPAYCGTSSTRAPRKSGDFGLTLLTASLTNSGTGAGLRLPCRSPEGEGGNPDTLR